MTSDHTAPCNDGLDVAAYVAGVMPPEDRPRFEEHLARCDTCRKYLVGLYRMGADVPEPVEPVKLDRAWGRVEQALDQWTREAEDEQTDPPALARVIQLRPRVRKPFRPHDAGALAAATAQTSPLSAITYASDDSDVIGKVGRDEPSGDLLLYLLADDGSILDGSRVVARDVAAPHTAEGSPDRYGVVRLADTASWSPETMLVELHLRR